MDLADISRRDIYGTLLPSRSITVREFFLYGNLISLFSKKGLWTDVSRLQE